jgi:hypothetical protein
MIAIFAGGHPAAYGWFRPQQPSLFWGEAREVRHATEPTPQKSEESNPRAVVTHPTENTSLLLATIC